MASNLPSDRIRICQWNVRSIRAQRDFLRHWESVYCPHIMCVQETWLGPGTDFIYLGFTWFRVDRDSHGDGVAIVVRNDLAATKASPLPALPGAETCAVQVAMNDFRCTVVSVYVSSQALTFPALIAFLTALPRPFVVCGDFNAHHATWDGLRTNSNGKVIQRMLLTLPFARLLNDGTSTMVLRQAVSAPDLTIVSEDIAHGSPWAVDGKGVSWVHGEPLDVQ